MLWDSGLSVTIQIRVCQNPKALCLAKNAQSEAVKALGHSALSDLFLAFTMHVKTLQVDSVAEGQRLSLTYGGAKYNAAMHKVAVGLGALLPCRPLEDALLKLELQYGRDVLSGEYSKLAKMLAHSKSLQQVQGKLSGPSNTVTWMLEMLVLAFRVQLRAPSKATEGWLDKERKSGMPDFWFCLYVVAQAPLPTATNRWPHLNGQLSLLLTHFFWPRLLVRRLNTQTSSFKASWTRS